MRDMGQLEGSTWSTSLGVLKMEKERSNRCGDTICIVIGSGALRVPRGQHEECRT